MGNIIHRSATVTSFDSDLILRAHDKALELFNRNLVTKVIVSKMNGYKTFFIATSGSKEGRDEADEHEEALDSFYEWVGDMEHEDGSSSIQYVEVEYGDGGTMLKRYVD